MDDIDFLHPVKVGEIAVLRAQVEAIGRCSIEVGVQVFAENLETGLRTQTLNSHLVFVKVNEHLKPALVPTSLTPRGAAEEALFAAAQERREHRLGRLGRRAAAAADVRDDGAGELRWAFESCRSVLPEDTIFGNTMFPGKLLMDIDEAGGILSMRYIRGHVMTACVDALDFYAPISTHEVVTFKAALNYVGSSSLEIGVKVLTEVPWSGEVRHAWSLDVGLSDLATALKRGGISVGTITALRVLERSVSLRVSRIAVEGTRGNATLRGNEFRRLIGYDTLKSTLFAVSIDHASARFVGRGYGHGVGLDQWSAKTMAEQGYTAQQIAQYYYPGATLATLNPTSP